MNLSVVEKKVAKINEIEMGDQKPTFKQLDTLANLYKVPRWVFVSDHLPKKYQFDKAIPAFRKLTESNADVFNDHKVLSLTARVERLRIMIIELLEDMGETVPIINPPKINANTNPVIAAQKVRDWLNLSQNSKSFAGLKKVIEEKGIFIFMTSKYKGWSHIGKTVFRGLTIYHSKLPIIIINDSDFKKAQSFTLFHELGHIMRKESTVDDWEDYNNTIERWCNELAGNALMPAEQILSAMDADVNIYNLNTIKKIAKSFKVSPYACLVRLRQMQIINQHNYNIFENQLKDEYWKLHEKIKESESRPTRNRPKEILNQYGHIYTNTIFQAYHNQEINFHKLCKLFDLKNPSYAVELEKYL